MAFRVRPRTLEGLKRRAHELGRSQTALAERYIEEGIRTDEHPLIVFRDGAGGRRAGLAGTRLDVWQVVEAIRQHGGSADAAAGYLEVPVSRLRAGLSYYAEYRDEIDEWVGRANAVAQREETAWRRASSLG